MFSQIFVASVLAVSVQSVFAASCSRSYTVQEGDYCDKISQAQNVSTYQLAVVNANSVDSSCSNLKAGQSLCLAENAAEDCKTTYVVRSGDTCDRIASGAGLNTTMLYLNNPQIDETCSNIYTNEVLCIASTVQAPAVPSGGVTVTAPTTTIVVPPPTSTPAAPASVASTTPVVTSTPVVKAPTTTVKAPASTAKPAATSAAAVAGSGDDDDCDSTPADDDCDEDDGDDEDLPFCDEL